MAIRPARLSWEDTPALDSFAYEDLLLEATPDGVAIGGEVVYGTERWANFRAIHEVAATGLVKRSGEMIELAATLAGKS